jgi:DMSO reductase anchor subunit
MDPAALESPRASAAHTPLAIMLVLTQAAIGMVALDGLFAAFSHLFEVPRASGPIVITLATAIGLTGLGASVAHLGRPQWAFRAILGLRTSWMSREILVLGGFAGLLVGACALCWIGWGVQSGRLSEGWAWLEELRPAVQGMASAIGLIGLYCSVQIYAVTGRPLWRFDRTAFRFLSTALWVGLAAANLGVVAGGLAPGWVPTALILGLMVLTGLRLRLESEWMVRSDVPKDAIALARSVLLLEGDLASQHRLRRGLLLVAGLLLPMVQLVATGFATPVGFQIGLATMVMAVGLLSDLVERSLFFRSEAMPSMPGME